MRLVADRYNGRRHLDGSNPLSGEDNIFSRSLKPSIPPELFSLTSLENFAISENPLNPMFNSKLPTDFGKLTNLRELDLLSESVSGTLPTELFQLEKLSNLKIVAPVTGTIPSEIFMRQLEVLSLVTQQTGTLPTEIGLMQDLKTMQLIMPAYGKLPAELWHLPKLESLDLWNNVLDIDYDFTTNHIWKTIRFNYVGRVSTIPTEIGLLQNLTVFTVTGSDVNGNLPTEIGNCLMLEKIDVTTNTNAGIVGTIPSELGNLERVRKLDLGGNQLSGTIPSEITQMKLLTSLRVNMKMFSEESGLDPPLPDGLCDLEFLTDFIVNCGVLQAECGPL